MSQVLNAQNLTRYYSVSRGAFKEAAILKAVDGASFTLERGKTLAVVGESGCGKSTLARLVTMIELPTSGTLSIGGHNIVGATRETLRALDQYKPLVTFDNLAELHKIKQYAPHAGVSSWKSSVCRPNMPGAIRTSSRAGSASASALRVRWPPIPT